MTSKQIAIKVEKINKLYRIGLREKTHDNFAGAIFDFIKSPLQNYGKYRSLYTFDDFYKNPGENHPDIIWALRDISFEIEKGEAVGIIGRNGAGKSTLLKILCRITEPTSGRAEIRGKVSSLLEVGTGFHQELTGRENIYLNGTVLGMTRREVNLKFDEIVDFSGVEKFIDTPVKRYSSGMKVRLAFSVAAHLEPEILIVDEVLAVGDAEFQKKCINKMEDVGKEGRAVLFVSHNMQAIIRLCNRAILIDDAVVVDDGPAHHVVNAYLNPHQNIKALREWPDLQKAPGDNVVRLAAVRARTEDGQITDMFDIRQPIIVEMEYEVLESNNFLMPYLYFYNQNGSILFGTLDRDPAWKHCRREQGRYLSSVRIPGNFLAPGLTTVNSYIMTAETQTQRLRVENVVAFEVIDSFDSDSARGDYTGPFHGAVRPLLKWDTNYQNSTSKKQGVG